MNKTNMLNLLKMGYFIMATILLLDCTNNFPGTVFLRKFKYIYLGLLVLDFIIDKEKNISKSSFVVVGCLTLHTVLFGKIWVNPTVKDLTDVHFREMLIYLFLLFFLTSAIERYNLKLQFIESTCLSFTIFLVWCGITHFSNFVNPIYFIYVLSRNARIRSEFGTSSPNYMGYYCFIALIFYYALFYEYWKNGRLTQKIKYYLFIISAWTILILFSTGSRSSILSFIIFSIFCFYQIYLKQHLKNSEVIVIFVLLVAAYFVLQNWSSIWGDANRDRNISVNIPIFNRMNAFWTGMGYIESSGFYNKAYGFYTFPVDIYYLYIYLTTGVVGSVIIAVPLLYIMLNFIVGRDDFIKCITLPAYIAIIFDGFWQVNIFTYRYIATLFIGVLLILSISQQHNEKIGDLNEETE